MFGSFFKKKNDFSQLTLVLDIRSSSIGGAVIKIVGGGKPVEILASTREFFFFDNVVNADSFITRAEILLKTVLELLVHKQKYGSQIGAVEVFYGAPWYKNLIENFLTNEKSAVDFNQNYLNKILKESVKKIGDDEEIIDRELLAMFLNGYYTKNPFGKKARTIDLSFYFAILNKHTKNNFVSIIRKFTNIKNISHHSHTIAFYNLLRNVIHPPKSYVMFDISGEVTEISIIKNEHLIKIISVPHGNNYFVRQLMQKTSHDFATCFNEIKTKNNLIDDISKTEWAECIAECLSTAQLHSLPSTVYVSTAEETRDLVKNILSNIEVYYSTLKMHTKPELIMICNSLFRKRIHVEQIGQRDDAHMMANILYVELMSKKS